MMKSFRTHGMEVNVTLGVRNESKTLVQWKAWTLVVGQDDLRGGVELGGGFCLVLPACWGGGGAGCRHKTSAPPPELG